MANNFPPSVFVKKSNVEIGATVLFKDMFEVTEIEGNAITKYRFRDNGAANYSGFFALAGVKQIAGGWIEISSAQLDSVSYYAGLLFDTESIGVQVFDGKFWSTASFGLVSSVAPNNRKPIVSAVDGNVLQSELRTITELFSASDPDGYLITQYRLVDRQTHSTSGYMTLYGTRLSSGTWHLINAGDLNGIRYVGGGAAQTEKIGVMAYDGKTWSDEAEFNLTTDPNSFAPVVSVYNLASPIGRVIDAITMYTVADQDGNTIKQIRFLDTGTSISSGYFTINGIRQTSNEFFTVGYNQISSVQYHYSPLAEFERYRVQVYDGKFWSEIAAGEIRAVTTPEIDFGANGRDLVIDELQDVSLTSVFNKSDAGPSFSQYQVIDLTPDHRTANLTYNEVDLESRTVHTFTATQFQNVEIEGAVNDFGRNFDSMMVRAFNGVFWSGWEKFNVSTEPVADRSLYIPATLTTQDPFSTFVNAKQTFNATTGKWVITYGFIDGGSPLPSYYGPDSPEAIGTTPLAHSQREMIRDIFADFEMFADLDFVEVPFNQAGIGIDMVFGANLQSGSQAYAYLPIPWSNGRVRLDQDFQSDIWANTSGPTDPANPDNSDGGYGRLTFVHEIGHALGFKHPFDPSPVLPISVDYHNNSVMSYSSSPFHVGSPMTPMLYDITALQTIYGANEGYRTGNDTYVFDLDNTHMQAFWDAGGEDTLNYGNQVLGATIDLRQGRVSSLNGVDNSLLIPFGVQIENARGSRNNDTIFGNETRNLLFGNEGNDRLVGNGGEDVLRGGAGGDTYLWALGDGTDTIREESSGGRDFLEIQDPTGRLNSIDDDMTFRRFGRDLRIDIAFDRGETVGSILIKDMSWGGSRVETLRFNDANGQQIGTNIDLNSVFVQATDVRTRFQLSNNQTQFGFIAVPV